MSTTIPAFYRLWFTIIDPALSLFGVLSSMFAPHFILRGYSPSPIDPPAIETSVLIDLHIGCYASLAFLQAILLRARPTDVVVWRILQASTAIMDAGVVLAFSKALSTQGRLHWSQWREDEVPQICINGALVILRMAFILGVGFSKTKKSESTSGPDGSSVSNARPVEGGRQQPLFQSGSERSQRI